ncbi:MAG: V-type ATP synthase subunit A [Bacteroidales bacterium]|nr:V-type ATP synthase subunit A [Bacteroidales bacterium]
MKNTTGKVISIISNLVAVQVDGPVAQNEICMIECEGTKLMSEVIKIVGSKAYTQVFESTRGLKIGSHVEFQGHMLELTLGPGLLSRNFDGLQNDLEKMEGVFLKRGEYTQPLDTEKKWHFTPTAKEGDIVEAASWLGEVKEGWLPHRIMVPFKCKGSYTLKWLAEENDYTISDHIATLIDSDGNEEKLTMAQKWPVKIAITAYDNKPRPFRIMETGVRAIDTFNPLAEGGTGFVPGPFGAGKTVLQHGISKQAETDIVIVAACGERANEVVEIFTEFPHLIDARTGRKLMERTTIICNTSNMPVAAREASVYTAMTIGEYYRSMGLRVLLLADSTSRWAQALREMSNRLEELPGADAFPMDLPAIISNYYARAGFVYLKNGQTGSITFIGNVSPAGGNLKEPVTEATKKTARCFYALAQSRADSKRYPAIDPVDSYSKYLEYPEIVEYLDNKIEKGWVAKVYKGKTIVQRGREVNDQINILGDDGVPVEFHDRFWKSELIDFVILQQDAFDEIDANCPLERQKFMYNKILDICDMIFDFKDFEECATFYKRIINICKQMNYSEYQSKEYDRYVRELAELIEERRTN